LVGPDKGRFFWLFEERRRLLGAGVFGDSLGAFADSVLGQLSGKEKSDSSLDLPTGDGASLVVVSEAGSFSGDTFEDVIHERVHDTHRLGADSGIGVNLLEHLVDVDAVRFLPPALLLLLI